MRRTPEAIITAHVMDPERRELYVEGKRDRLFLESLLANSGHKDAKVLEITTVDLPNETEGGERARLMEFARRIEGKKVNVRCFADADFDRLLGRGIPGEVWLTDPRDLEGYTLCIPCIEKTLKLGLATESVTAEEVLETVKRLGRPLGFLRLLSQTRELNLPFQAGSLRRHLQFQNGQLHLKFCSYVQSLLQNAGISLREKTEVLRSARALERKYARVPDSEILHGKDCFCIIEKMLSRYGAPRGKTEWMLWVSFDESLVASGSSLDEVLTYLRNIV